MPMYEFKCNNCEKVCEKYISRYSQLEEDPQFSFLSEEKKDCESSEKCDFVLIMSDTHVMDPWRLGRGAKKLPSGFKERMNQIAKNNPGGNVKTYNRTMI